MALQPLFNGDKVRTKVEEDSVFYNLLGKVEDYSDSTEYYVVKFANGKREIFRREELRKITTRKKK